MYAESELIPLSALQHYLFCRRQCALIHIEQVWIENRYTAEGRLMHEKVDTGKKEKRGDVILASGLPLKSLQLGLSGKADMVEFHLRNGRKHPFPVEYKRGKPKRGDEDKVQLCAQAICLEEMLQIAVPAGALFYGKSKRRLNVELSPALREKTKRIAEATHLLLNAGITPQEQYSKKCDNCSLLPLCEPKLTNSRDKASRFVAKALDELCENT